jgi:hypothetical protein
MDNFHQKWRNETHLTFHKDELGSRFLDKVWKSNELPKKHFIKTSL